MNQGHLVGLITTWIGELRDRKRSQTGRCWEKHFSVREASLEKNNDKAYFSLKCSHGLLPDDNPMLTLDTCWDVSEIETVWAIMVKKRLQNNRKSHLNEQWWTDATVKTIATKATTKGFYLSSSLVIQVLGWDQSQFDSKDLGPHVF